MKKILGAVGCSHTSTDYGNSWPIYLGKQIGYSPIIASSNGAGNGMFIDKVKSLCEKSCDLIIVQLTEPTRISLGMKSYDQGSPHSKYNAEMCDGQYHNGTGYYTWSTRNDEYFKKNLSYNTQVDQIWVNEVMDSAWIRLYTAQNIVAMTSICNWHSIPVIFFSWFVDVKTLIPKEYYQMIKSLVIPGCAMDVIKSNAVPALPDNHYGSDGHKTIVDQWLSRQIQNYML